ncbi:hypothetical protein [Rhodothermus profundi]|uniref:Uncharacterized protein n=1 Tax=Rhodothermus profundi TaxID=633813 RepID=A0A1M6SUQ5_9BACT|nr:hypothetical protein [Rhodothermus profundi]SHK48377.1 hypothetical protein SAMN04488087_1233 [Rhodothermus profundi]
MASRKRRGMIIKNTNDVPVEIPMSTRTIRLKPGEEAFLTAEEVRDPVLREKLQVRAVSIVRPTTEEEEEQLRQQLAQQQSS